MTISVDYRRTTPYFGNNVTTIFPFSFKIFTATDVQVVVTDALGNEEVYVIGTQYSVQVSTDQENLPGGTVTMVTPLASGLSMVIRSVIPYTQTLDVTNPGGFYPTSVNNAFDRTVALIQQVKDAVDNSDSANTNLVLPAEKRNIAAAWALIQAEYAAQSGSGTLMAVVGTEYAQAYNDLSAFITPILADLTTSSTISRTTYNTRIGNYYVERAQHQALIIVAIEARLP